MKKILFGILILSTTIVSAQFTEILSSDRPGQALSTNVVGKNVFQIQPGIDYFKNSKTYLPNSYFRYGISNRVELNYGLAIVTGNSFTQIAGFSIGTRISLSEKASNVTSALQISANLPVENLEFGTQVIYTMGGNFTKNLGWTTNFGANFDDNFNTTGVYVFNLSYSISEKIGIFVEPFGTFINNSNLAFDTGFYYLANNNFQLDFSLGDNQGLFFGLGATFRILPKK